MQTSCDQAGTLTRRPKSCIFTNVMGCRLCTHLLLRLEHPVELCFAVLVLARAQRVSHPLQRIHKGARAVVRRIHLHAKAKHWHDSGRALCYACMHAWRHHAMQACLNAAKKGRVPESVRHLPGPMWLGRTRTCPALMQDGKCVIKGECSCSGLSRGSWGITQPTCRAGYCS